MVILIAVLSFITVLMLALGILSYFGSEQLVIAKRLRNIGKTKNVSAHEELNLPLYTRIIKPLIDEINKKVSNLMPSEIKSKIEKKLMMAGNPFGFTVSKWINLQIFLLVGFPLFTLLVAYLGGADFKRLSIVMVLEIALAFVMPRMILSQKVTERQDNIVKQLPDILDLLTVSVEAGLGFDAALAKVVERVPGELSSEFLKVIQEIKVGTPRREALKNMTKRVGVSDVVTFVGSIIQADQLGVSIGHVLRIQSNQMRQKRRQRAQEKAMKAPVKMLFPMVFFIFPTIFAVLLGPVLIKLMDSFMK